MDLITCDEPTGNGLLINLPNDCVVVSMLTRASIWTSELGLDIDFSES